MPKKANKGEWAEPYAAIRMLGEGRLFLADAEGNRNPNEWMEVVELIRHETKDRVVTYTCSNSSNVDVEVDGTRVHSAAMVEYLAMAEQLADEIRRASTTSFEVSRDIEDFFERIELKHIKAKSIDKSDLFLSLRDPRASITRKHVGFSIKSEFGHKPTLFNTAKASAVIYKVDGMTDELMNEINAMSDEKGHAAISERCDALIANGCRLSFVGFPVATRAGVAAFEENLELINPRLPQVIERILWGFFFGHDTGTDFEAVTKRLAENNPCDVTRPEVTYEYMIKAFLYAAYCGMTASTLWDGKSQVNGGFIRVSRDGEVVAHYALESDEFKSYLFKNCHFEFPSTSETHGNYAKVYKEGDEYYFRLNFQIRYK